MIRSLSSREKMSNSRSPRAVRSMTMGTRGIAPDELRRSGRIGGRGRARSRPSMRSIRRADACAGPAAAWRRRRPARVRSTSIASSARSSASTRCAAASSCCAVQRRQRGAAARDHADRLEQLLGRRPPCRPARRRPPRARAARACGRRRRCRASTLRRGRRAPAAGGSDEAVAVGQVVLEQHDVGPLARDQLEPVGDAVRAPTGTSPGSVRRSIASPARTAG